MNVRQCFPSRKRNGFTLIELLVVITIMSLLLAVMVPGAGLLDEHARAKATHETFKALRTAILGPDGLADASGQRIVGGFVGRAGHLPQLYAMKWDPARGRMVQDLDSDLDGDGMPDTVTTDRGPTGYGDSCGQPLALWIPALSMREGGQSRSWISEPVDIAPEDQIDLWVDSPDRSLNRHFRLHEGAGRLVDGWGRAILVFVDTTEGGAPDIRMDDELGVVPNSLIFVSTGPDGDYEASDPSDMSKDQNRDNLVMRITKGDWIRNEEKRTKTQDLLEAMRLAILGRSGVSVDGLIEPNGFVADIGGVEPLTGSYVTHDAGGGPKVYRCKHAHLATTPPNAAPDFWEDLEASHGSSYSNHSSFFPKWEAGRKYHHPSLDALATNSVLALRHGILRKTREATSGSYDAAKWSDDNSFAIIDSSRYLHDETPGRLYDSTIVGSLRYDAGSRLSVGWAGPYLHGIRSLPISDAWEHGMDARIDSLGNVVLRSPGPDLTDPDDDLEVTILRLEYLVALHVEVTFAAGFASTDTLKVLLPHDGRPSFRWLNPLPSGTSQGFDFSTASGSVPAATSFTGTPEVATPNGAMHLPIGRRTLRFKNATGTDSLNKRITLHSRIPHASVTLP
jgi:prepilin-type N-terminal cleavage/methylation domain-containing protein